jgi:hypothetical protein
MTIRSKPPNKNFYDNYDRIFKKVSEKIKPKKKSREEAAAKGLRTNGEEI